MDENAQPPVGSEDAASLARRDFDRQVRRERARLKAQTGALPSSSEVTALLDQLAEQEHDVADEFGSLRCLDDDEEAAAPRVQPVEAQPAGDAASAAAAPLLMVAQAILDAQGNRPTYAKFARPPAENPFDDPLLAVLRRAAAAATATQLEPRSFFVAWSGVLVLAYDGFTPPLASIKRALNESELPLCRESFGSKWPKTTLGAVADDAPPLTAAQLAALKALCLRHSEAFTGCAVPVRAASLVSYDWRGLEQLTARDDCVMMDAPDATPEPPTDEERSRVSGVLAEWDDVDAYLAPANQAGSRASTYRHASPTGRTIVCFLDAAAAPSPAAPPTAAPTTTALLSKVAMFQAEVDALLPGRYVWLAPASLHVTLRAADAV